MSEQLHAGEWVRISRFPTRWAHLKDVTFASFISYAHPGAETVDVTVYNEEGVALGSFSVNRRWLKKTDPPKYRNLTSDIPETEEVQRAKVILYSTMMRYKTEHSLCGVLERTMGQLGIEKPPPGKVKVRVVLEGEVDLDKVMSGATYQDFATEFGKLDPRQQASYVLPHLPHRDVAELTYEVLPPERPVAQAPTPAA